MTANISITLHCSFTDLEKGKRMKRMRAEENKGKEEKNTELIEGKEEGKEGSRRNMRRVNRNRKRRWERA